MENRKLANLKKQLNDIKQGRKYYSVNNQRLKKIALRKTRTKQLSRCELYDVMPFLYPQAKKSLIPQIKFAEDDLDLAKEIKKIRQELSILFSEKIEEISANYSASDDSEKIY